MRRSKRARLRKDLLVVELSDETLVYDPEGHCTHLLRDPYRHTFHLMQECATPGDLTEEVLVGCVEAFERLDLLNPSSLPGPPRGVCLSDGPAILSVGHPHPVQAISSNPGHICRP